MRLYALVEGGIETGATLLILDPKEGQRLVRVMEAYCLANKRDRAARKMLKDLQESLLCHV
jgi:urease accessory protein UreF